MNPGWTRHRRWRFFALPLALATSCGGPRVSDVYSALDSGGERRRTEFFTDTESIYCIADIAGAAKGTTVNAKIRIVQIAGRGTDLLIAIGEDVVSDATPTTVAFQLQKPQDATDAPWPVGKFECDILLDGALDGSAIFDITMPACPVYPVSPGEVCAGYYPPGARCPAIDQTMTCTCGPEGVWGC